MKALILAAGQGTRLRPLTDDRPKCLVEIAGRPILDHQLAVLRSAGLDDITALAGYRADQVARPGLKTIVNPDYASTNMVSTLFTDPTAFEDGTDLVVSYGDIVYEPRVLSALLASTAPVTVAVDTAWRPYWEARMEDPLDDAESLRVDGDRLLELGKKPRSIDEIQGQYMGLVKIRADSVARLYATWSSMDRSASYDGKSFEQMYFTSFLQHLIDTAWDVRAAFVENGWLEIDSPSDLAMAEVGFWRPNSEPAT